MAAILHFNYVSEGIFTRFFEEGTEAFLLNVRTQKHKKWRHRSAGLVRPCRPRVSVTEGKRRPDRLLLASPSHGHHEQPR